MKVAEYECECGCQWKEEIPQIQTKQPFQIGANDCPNCGSLYVKWINYEKDFVK